MRRNRIKQETLPRTKGAASLDPFFVCLPERDVELKGRELQHFNVCVCVCGIYRVGVGIVQSSLKKGELVFGTRSSHLSSVSRKGSGSLLFRPSMNRYDDDDDEKGSSSTEGGYTHTHTSQFSL
jgi:hypothetical protein